ncbi:MAG: SDR family NAD(P)-dependent oxidoreductase [Candidatus Thorarchaeota archaeon]
MDTGLQNKHVVVTGASSGIGFELVKLYLLEGANVTACYNSALRNLADLKKKYVKSLNIVQVDVRDEVQVDTLFKKANAEFGRVDITIANAGIANHEGVAVHEMSLDQWSDIIAVNLTGAFLCAKHFFANLKAFPQDDACLILVGSTAGVFGEAWYADYSTSKAGLHGLLMSLKNEIVLLAVRGRVNLVNPGWTVTPMAEGALNDHEMVSKILQTVPLRKVGKPFDIANAILYLSSDKISGHVSGQTINVAGGMEGRVLFSSDEVRDYIEK